MFYRNRSGFFWIRPLDVSNDRKGLLDACPLLPVSVRWGGHTDTLTRARDTTDSWGTEALFGDLVNESVSLNIKLTNRTTRLCPFALCLVFFGYGGGKSGLGVNCTGGAAAPTAPCHPAPLLQPSPHPTSQILLERRNCEKTPVNDWTHRQNALAGRSRR